MKKLLILLALLIPVFSLGVTYETVGYAVAEGNGAILVHWTVASELRPIPADMVKIRPWKSSSFNVTIIEFSGDTLMVVDDPRSFKLPARIVRLVP